MIDISSIKTTADLDDINLGQLSLEELEQIYAKIKDTIPTKMILATSNGIICYPEHRDSNDNDVELSNPYKRMTAKRHRSRKWRNGKKK